MFIEVLLCARHCVKQLTYIYIRWPFRSCAVLGIIQLSVSYK